MLLAGREMLLGRHGRLKDHAEDPMRVLRHIGGVAIGCCLGADRGTTPREQDANLSVTVAPRNHDHHGYRVNLAPADCQRALIPSSHGRFTRNDEVHMATGKEEPRIIRLAREEDGREVWLDTQTGQQLLGVVERDEKQFRSPHMAAAVTVLRECGFYPNVVNASHVCAYFLREVSRDAVT